MADEQYEWLDKEAAERLLRREPVDPVDGQQGQDADRLAAALDAAARSARPAAGELPGEAAALAAFRAAPRSAARTRAASARAGRGPAAGPDGAGGTLAPVHIGRAGTGHGPGARPPSWSRPVRFGLVASLACCAIGGVAVAAGTGVLPGPFGRHAPAPATSVSAAASPEELGSGLTADDGTPEPPTGTPSPKSSPPEARDSARPGGKNTEGPGRTGPATDGGTGAGTHEDPAGGVPDSTKGTGGDGDGSGQPGTSGTWYAKTLKACRDYRDGKLDDDRRRRLEELAKGARNLDRFCERMLDAADGKSGNGGGSGNGGSGRDGDSSGNGGDPDGDGHSPSGGFGSLPSIDFSPVSPQPSAAFAGPDPGTDPATDPGADAGASPPVAPAEAR
uniref:Extensin n=1 Tax=Streptomyces sp. NBC_00008 TaxID=2903610 RepID=A0AAU2VPF4_9ACTN